MPIFHHLTKSFWPRYPNRLRQTQSCCLRSTRKTTSLTRMLCSVFTLTLPVVASSGIMAGLDTGTSLGVPLRPGKKMASLTKDGMRCSASRRGDQPESTLLRQSRRSLPFHSNSDDCWDPKESTVPTRVVQTSRASLSEGESREVPFDS